MPSDQTTDCPAGDEPCTHPVACEMRGCLRLDPPLIGGPPPTLGETTQERFMAAEIAKHRAEIDALKAAWLRVIQAENSCRATGLPCGAKRCWCEMERQELANVEGAVRE